MFSKFNKLLGLSALCMVITLVTAQNAEALDFAVVDNGSVLPVGATCVGGVLSTNSSTSCTPYSQSLTHSSNLISQANAAIDEANEAATACANTTAPDGAQISCTAPNALASDAGNIQSHVTNLENARNAAITCTTNLQNDENNPQIPSVNPDACNSVIATYQQKVNTLEPALTSLQAGIAELSSDDSTPVATASADNPFAHNCDDDWDSDYSCDIYFDKNAPITDTGPLNVSNSPYPGMGDERCQGGIVQHVGPVHYSQDLYPGEDSDPMGWVNSVDSNGNTIGCTTSATKLSSLNSRAALLQERLHAFDQNTQHCTDMFAPGDNILRLGLTILQPEMTAQLELLDTYEDRLNGCHGVNLSTGGVTGSQNSGDLQCVQFAQIYFGQLTDFGIALDHIDEELTKLEDMLAGNVLAEQGGGAPSPVTEAANTQSQALANSVSPEAAQNAFDAAVSDAGAAGQAILDSGFNDVIDDAQNQLNGAIETLEGIEDIPGRTLEAIDKLINSVLKTQVMQMNEFLNNPLSVISDDFGTRLEQAAQNFTRTIETIESLLQGAVNQGIADFNAGIGGIEGAFETASSAVTNLPSTLGNAADAFGNSFENSVNSAIENEIAHINDQINQAEADLNDLNQQLNDLPNQIGNEVNELENQINAEIAQAESDLNNLNNEINNLENDLNNEINNLENNINNELNQAEADIADFQNQINDLNQQLADAPDNLQAAYDAQINDLNQQMAGAQDQFNQELNNLNTQLNDVGEALVNLPTAMTNAAANGAANLQNQLTNEMNNAYAEAVSISTAINNLPGQLNNAVAVAGQIANTAINQIEEELSVDNIMAGITSAADDIQADLDQMQADMQQQLEDALTAENVAQAAMDAYADTLDVAPITTVSVDYCNAPAGALAPAPIPPKGGWNKVKVGLIQSAINAAVAAGADIPTN